MRTDRGRFHEERRRRHDVVSPLFLSRKDGEEGREGKQDKGRVSRPCISDCLHILFQRDERSQLRDSPEENFRNPALFFRNRETRDG